MHNRNHAVPARRRLTIWLLLGLDGAAAAAAGARLHRFSRLTVAGEVSAGAVAVVTRLRLDDADLILGGDFLAAHRVWLGYGARMVYLAPRD